MEERLRSVGEKMLQTLENAEPGSLEKIQVYMQDPKQRQEALAELTEHLSSFALSLAVGFSAEEICLAIEESFKEWTRLD